MNPNLDGLFGLSPEMIGRQQYEMMRARAAQEAQMSDIERANYGMRTAGATLGHVGAGMLGSGNPAIEEAKMRESVMGMGGDLTTSAGLKAKAQQFKDAGDTRTALKLAIAAKEQEVKEQELMLSRNKDAREELKMNREAIWKHEESLEKLRLREREIENDMKVAQQRGEDTAKYRDAMIENRRAMIAVAQMNAGNKPTEPLVQIIGADGNPTWATRTDAIGKTPAGAGSKAETIAAGKTEIDRDVLTLKSALDQLNAGGGITSTAKGVLPNISAWTANTGVGQTLGSMGGTNNQKARDVILQARPLLLRSIMQATGMSARSLDSNAELKLWLSTATDPTKGYEANIEALNNIVSKYGSGGFLDKGTKPIQPAKPSSAVDAALEKYK